MAEGFGLLHARDGDCADRGGGDHHHCRGRVPADENGSYCEGCGRREGQEDGEEGCAEEDQYEGCEGLVCLLLNRCK